MKRLICTALALVLLSAFLPSGSLAGDPDVNIYLLSGDGADIPVYKTASDKAKPIGTLISGQMGWYDITQQKKNGWIRLDYPVEGYVRESMVVKCGDHFEREDGKAEPACNPRVVKAQAGALLKEGTAKKAKTLGKLPEGLKLLVLGTFGDHVFVESAGRGISGYIRKSDVLETSGTVPLYDQPVLETVQVYPADGLTGAPGYISVDKDDCQRPLFKGEMKLYQQLDDWALVGRAYGARLVESRFLDPDGDHSLPVRYVKTSSDTNRLLLREEPVQNGEYASKLFAGAKLTVVGTKGEWTQVAICDAMGWVQTKYLADSPVSNMTVSAVLTADYKGFFPGEALTANTGVTLIGSQGASMIALTADGSVFNIPMEILARTDGGSLPAKTTRNVKLRLRADDRAKELHTIKKGAKVTVLIQGDVWSKVEYNGLVGYCMTRYLKF